MVWRWASALVLMGLLGCDSRRGGEIYPEGPLSGLGETCRKTADCNLDLVCIEHICAPPAVLPDAGGADALVASPDASGPGPGGADSGPGTDTVGGQVAEGGACQSSEQCAGALVCVGQHCRCADPRHGGTGCDQCKDGGEFPDCIGCVPDGYCNAEACSLASDPDCNPAAPCDPGVCGDNHWDPGCTCNYYGGVCEIAVPCSDTVCVCDTDCTPPSGELKPGCVADGHCDSWCPKNGDPDCAGSPKNGAKCGGPGCDTKAGYCNVEPGTLDDCPGDPDCFGSSACEGDGWCDVACPSSADPDCATSQPEDCSNGADDDGDHMTDCNDPDCKGSAACSVEICGNGKDDDGDGKFDCADADCESVCPEQCDNGKDDDGDGKVDCADSECVGKANCKENCLDGVDNDSDGKTDCADTDCKASPACKEDCNDGKDNDVDGLKDCADPDCEDAVVCSGEPETCNDVYLCLTEEGCDCTMGVDCPSGEAVGACIHSCFASATCTNGCVASVSQATQNAWYEWQQCLKASCPGLSGDALKSCYVQSCLGQYANCFFGCESGPGQNAAANKWALVSCTKNSCAGATTEQEVTKCYLDSCLAQATQCLYGGTATCEEGFFGCYLNCPNGDAQCESDCFASLSSQGAYDLFTWDGCRFGLCDANGDGSADSTGCLTAAFLGCSDAMGSCGGGWQGDDTCAQTVECVLGCGGFGAGGTTCMDGCVAAVSEAELPEISGVFSCAITACGTTAQSLTAACITKALDGACAAEYAACLQ